MSPEVAHLEPDYGHDSGGDDTEDGDHGDTGDESPLEGLDAGVESNHVEDGADEVCPLGVGSVSTFRAEKEEHHEEVGEDGVKDGSVEMGIKQFFPRGVSSTYVKMPDAAARMEKACPTISTITTRHHFIFIIINQLRNHNERVKLRFEDQEGKSSERE